MSRDTRNAVVFRELQRQDRVNLVYLIVAYTDQWDSPIETELRFYVVAYLRAIAASHAAESVDFLEVLNTVELYK